MEPVEQAAHLGDVDLVHAARVDVGQELAQATDLVGDLDVGAAHGGHRVGATEEAAERRVEDLLLGVLVRLDLVDEHPVHVPRLGQGGGGIQSVQGVGDVVQPVDVAPDGQVLLLEAPGEERVLRTQAGLGGPRAQGAQCVEDHGDVDELLEDRPPHRREEARRREPHRRQ